MSRIPDIQRLLRDDIISGSLPFGSRLRIDELATRYGVSHMPIREALRELHGEGLVVIEPNRGARVRSIDLSFRYANPRLCGLYIRSRCHRARRTRVRSRRDFLSNEVLESSS